MSAQERWKQIQAVLGTVQDGIPGAKDADALTKLEGDALAEYRASRGVNGVLRTDWRGFKEVDVERLKAAIPPAAHSLLPLFIQNARKYDLNPLFLIAISRHETGAWTSNVFRTKSNAMGISNRAGAVSQENYDASIRMAAFSLSRLGGYYSNAKTLEDVARIYAPPGAANDPTNLNGYWPGQVAKYWADYERALA